MNQDRALLCRIAELREPRHLFILPEWAEPKHLEKLIEQGDLKYAYEQRDENGQLEIVMGLQLTEKGHAKVLTQTGLMRLVATLSGIAACWAVAGLTILYWG